MGFEYKELEKVTTMDADSLMESQMHYGDSWKQRGGVGAFMMLARKWDRIENAALKHHYDIFESVRVDARAEGVIDDIRDLRRYLVLVEAELLQRGFYLEEVTKGSDPVVHKKPDDTLVTIEDSYTVTGAEPQGYVNQD